MNRNDLVLAVAEREHLPVLTAERAITSFLDIIVETLAKETPVKIRGFGKLEPRYRKPVNRRNPRTGEVVSAPAFRTTVFIPSPILKVRLTSG